jgi:hypothetical protein
MPMVSELFEKRASAAAFSLFRKRAIRGCSVLLPCVLVAAGGGGYGGGEEMVRNCIIEVALRPFRSSTGARVTLDKMFSC